MLHPLSARPDQVKRALKALCHDARNILQPQGKELDLLIVILPDNNGSLYGVIPLKHAIPHIFQPIMPECLLTINI